MTWAVLSFEKAVQVKEIKVQVWLKIEKKINQEKKSTKKGVSMLCLHLLINCCRETLGGILVINAVCGIKQKQHEDKYGKRKLFFFKC